MVNQCFICGWNKGYPHRHHIIPLSQQGEDTNKNKIFLCPNHHSECHKIGSDEFRIRYKLPTGERLSEQKITAMNKTIKICLEHFPDDEDTRLTPLTKLEYHICNYLRLRFNFTHYEALSLHMGVGIPNLCKNLGLEHIRIKKEIMNFKETSQETFNELIKEDENYKIIHDIAENG